MFILAKRNIIIPSPETGMKPVVLKKDGFATVPDWAAETAYFKALCADGKIVATKAAQAAAEKPVKTRRAKAEEKPAEADAEAPAAE